MLQEIGPNMLCGPTSGAFSPFMPFSRREGRNQSAQLPTVTSNGCISVSSSILGEDNEKFF